MGDEIPEQGEEEDVAGADKGGGEGGDEGAGSGGGGEGGADEVGDAGGGGDGDGEGDSVLGRLASSCLEREYGGEHGICFE